jgi:alpha-1,2-mannosidase, putative
MRKSALPIAAIAFGLVTSAAISAPIPGPAAFVDPFIGTAGHGHTFPGATVPFGMVQVSPDTGLNGWDRCSGYHSDDTTLLGFSHTHLSGTGASDLGNILFMPSMGEVVWDPIPGGRTGSGLRHDDGYRERIDRSEEKASPGYYTIKLKDVRVELTASERAAMHRYTFANSGNASLLIDLAQKIHGGDRPNAEGTLTIENPTTVSGSQRTGGWGGDKTWYFVAQFSEPIVGNDFRVDGSKVEGKKAEGNRVRGSLDFKVRAAKPLVIKVGLSPTSIEAARRNLEKEIGGKDFDAVRTAAVEKWNKELGRFAIETKNDAEKRTFFTAVYHAMIAPNLYNDADGTYIGPDREVRKDPGYNYYSTFSLWDTFRAAHPLFTLVQPERTKDFLKTMVRHYELSSFKQLPVWTLTGNDNWCMIGYHSIPVIVDAYFKGYTDFDTDKALEGMISSSNRREGAQHYAEKGWVPASDDHAQGASRTLEYAYDDWCIARFAEALGKKDIAAEYDKRAKNYLNVFDKEAGLMRGRLEDGSWKEPYDPTVVDTSSFTEGNAWQYSWTVMQDVPALIELMGGPEKFTAKLDEMWETENMQSHLPDVTGLIGQYAHGNEPSHHVAYLYDFAGKPWLTQKWVRRVMKEMYTDKRDGICGNEDCGQMSAWYVFSALGFYPVNPASGIYMIGSPLFAKAGIKVGPENNPKTFVVIAEKNSPENIYIQSATLNGKPLDRAWITHKELAAGGELKFVMGSKPNEAWGAKNLPPAMGY